MSKPPGAAGAMIIHMNKGGILLNIIEETQSALRQGVAAACTQAMAAGTLPEAELPDFVIETPKDEKNGDFSTNLAMQLTRILRQNPRKIAEAIVVHEPKISKEALRARVLELMELVEIDKPMERMKLYPHNFSGGIRGRGARVNHTKRGTACRAFCFYSVISSTRCSMAVCRFIYTTFRRPSLSLHMAGWHLFPGAAASSIRFFQVFPSSFE